MIRLLNSNLDEKEERINTLWTEKNELKDKTVELEDKVHELTQRPLCQYTLYGSMGEIPVIGDEHTFHTDKGKIIVLLKGDFV